MGTIVRLELVVEIVAGMVQAAAVFFEVGAGLLDQRSRDWLQLPVRFGLGQHCLWRYDAEAS